MAQLSSCLYLALNYSSAAAHPIQFTTLQVRIEPDGNFHAVLNIDVLAFALHKTSEASTNEELQALLDSPRSVLGADLADAGDHFKDEVVVRTDAGNAPVTSWTLPGLSDVNNILARHLHPSILMPGDIAFSGTLPVGAKQIAVRLPYVLGDTLQVFELPQGDASDEQVLAGAYSSNVAVTLQPPSYTDRLAVLCRSILDGIQQIFLRGW